jgi:hypothetical protein
VAALLARGWRNREIAERLTISPLTAERHVANILNKLGARSRTEVGVWAAAHGLQAAPPRLATPPGAGPRADRPPIRPATAGSARGAGTRALAFAAGEGPA